MAIGETTLSSRLWSRCLDVVELHVAVNYHRLSWMRGSRHYQRSQRHAVQQHLGWADVWQFRKTVHIVPTTLSTKTLPRSMKDDQRLSQFDVVVQIYINECLFCFANIKPDTTGYGYSEYAKCCCEEVHWYRKPLPWRHLREKSSSSTCDSDWMISDVVDSILNRYQLWEPSVTAAQRATWRASAARARTGSIFPF